MTQFIFPGSCVEPATFENDFLEDNYRSSEDKPVDQNDIEKFLTWYFARDNVGIVNNMHLAYCDLIGPDGPFRLESLILGQMCNIAVDFAKHGEYFADLTAVEYITDELKDHGYPDFMEKVNKEKRVSTGVLGMLYRDVKSKEEEAVAAFVRQDY
mmetsp:Transcript_22745/g.30342  ORF Transcript_22745/g.30342 Transcript_22745/m.30342 type:complete len:155 (-) Transcript_22745:452-916(-)|eukprot:CAMPEP_0185572752 /NCGR_PEP_ID=MMETSP0434-20130131/4624_1 /TAXON_ID=626734 ORGANISM="Favella taraikaensis, Strain Fe Narragansett Bay" /NCGR_SAMPLE_ID=MMETSP0434 /ASSEMBLY_ACC=CAM_ASM_000379 /LENGTH=154 /DNA_ID=CAMNT_0028188733 /DNA_START=464 /DNA_END=928 /DNA_ORIENTATION=-